MFVDKYRPTEFDQVIGRADVIERIKDFIAKDGCIPHLLFSGIPGTGKTLLSEITAREILGDGFIDNFYQFNASQDRGIDMVREKIYNIAKNRPMNRFKIILMDEADAMTSDAQFALRRIIEQFSSQTRFIFTCNYRYRIIQPLLSRLIEFELDPIEPKKLAGYLKRIAGLEGKPGTDEYYVKIAKESAGDVRKALNLLEGTKGEVPPSRFDLSVDALKKMSKPEFMKIPFSGNPDDVFGDFWEFVKWNEMWDLIPYIADCQSKMNLSVHKTVFLCDLFLKVYDTLRK